jgi:hypothetical protein
MKTTPNDGHLRMAIKLRPFGFYVDEIYYLENAIASNPPRLQVDIAGSGRIPADTVLIMRSIIQNRSPETKFVTNARSSLQGAAVLIWLLGDVRMIRSDARLYFRSAGEFTDGRAGAWRDAVIFDEDPFEDDDYLSVLRVINEFLPVGELADQQISVSALKEYGLVESETIDEVLATALQAGKEQSEGPDLLPKKDTTEANG